MRSHSTFAVIALSLLAAACGNKSTPADMGAPSDVYPAPHTALPQMRDWGGNIQNAPILHAITWPGDAMQPDIETFVSGMATSTYWSATLSEYGVGSPSIATPVHMSSPAAGSIPETSIDAMLDSMISTIPELANPTANDQYLLFFPEGTKITDPSGDSCD